MNRALAGVFWAAAFVVLESIQFVFFGGLFQRMNSFLFGVLVFGITSVLFIAVAAFRQPKQFRIALANPRLRIAINLTATLA